MAVSRANRWNLSASTGLPEASARSMVENLVMRPRSTPVMLLKVSGSAYASWPCSRHLLFPPLPLAADRQDSFSLETLPAATVHPQSHCATGSRTLQPQTRRGPNHAQGLSGQLRRGVQWEPTADRLRPWARCTAIERRRAAAATHRSPPLPAPRCLESRRCGALRSYSMRSRC